jgi:hypothetical protein
VWSHWQGSESHHGTDPVHARTEGNSGMAARQLVR